MRERLWLGVFLGGLMSVCHCGVGVSSRSSVVRCCLLFEVIWFTEKHGNETAEVIKVIPDEHLSEKISTSTEGGEEEDNGLHL